MNSVNITGSKQEPLNFECHSHKRLVLKLRLELEFEKGSKSILILLKTFKLEILLSFQNDLYLCKYVFVSLGVY